MRSPIVNIKIYLSMLFAFFALTFTHEASAQIAIAEFEQELDVPVIASVVLENGDLYVVHEIKMIGYRTAFLDVRKWNGLFWAKLPVLELWDYVRSEENKLDCIGYQDQFIIAGSFKSNNGIQGIVSWDGSQWGRLDNGLSSDYLIHPELSVEGMAVSNNALYICGDFNLVDNKSAKGLAKYDGASWEILTADKQSFTAIESIDDTLFVLGDFQEINGNTVSNLAALVDGRWTQVNTTFPGDYLGMCQLDNELVVVTTLGAFRKARQNWLNLLRDEYYFERLDAAIEHNGVLYLTGIFKTTANEIYRLLLIEQQNQKMLLGANDLIGNDDHRLLIEKSGENEISLLGTFSEILGKSANFAASFRPGYSVISGITYIDHNDNCTYDLGDEIQPNAIVSIDKEQYVSSDSKGNYSIFKRSNETAVLSVIEDINLENTCSSGSLEIKARNSDTLESQNLALKPRQGNIATELLLQGLSGYKVRHGYRSDYQISVSRTYKKSRKSYPVELTLEYDERLSEMEFSVNPVYIGDHSLRWLLNNDTVVHLSFVVSPSTIERGDSLEFHTILRSNDFQSALESSIEQVVVSAFDPNDKQCNKYEIGISEESLDYHIRFQNLGTDYARDVHIVDTISEELPIEYLQILQNSHFEKYATSYRIKDNTIIWSFRNINLPALSQSDEVGSSGFVSFKGGLRENLHIGQLISNKAEIYFDFQKPVITNTVISEVVRNQTSGHGEMGIRIYPNPSSGLCTIQSDYRQIESLDIIDASGRLLQSIKNEQDSYKPVIDLSHLQSGIYFIRTNHSLGSQTLKVLVDSN